MTFSVKKIFKKEDAQPEQATAEHTAADTVQTQSADESKQKKGKHGEPGFCCGSCS
ncbi:CCGSCS motif protein [Photobacterium sp. MCCC 1A19761]|uniref:CCGSCS motif protein n=1 Tax=Photobacterium sp. MCCC 1A19761 TaxID=3115000 RepID=UPI00307E9312